MKVITAIEDYIPELNDVTCFLAGGITNCPDWQQEVISELEKLDLEDLVIFNPRRPDFPIDDPNASYEQIKWEHTHLTECNIFSIYFSSGESLQPISLYELGKYGSYKPYKIISVEEGYKREQDVTIQMALDKNLVFCEATPKKHAEAIAKEYYLWIENH